MRLHDRVTGLHLSILIGSNRNQTAGFIAAGSMAGRFRRSADENLPDGFCTTDF